MKFKRVFLIIMNSLGVGEAPDANNYNDNGANTLKHIMDNYDLFVPNLKKLGFLNTINMDDNPNVEAYYTIARPNSIGKDSISGHYEIIGLDNKVPFKTFTERAFPIELIDAIEKNIGKRLIGNKVASGDVVLQELGDRHLAYGSLILYTSSESTLEIAAHEDIVPISKLYSFCEKIRKITEKEDWRVARVIARPFTGKNGKYKFTNDHKDYALKPQKRSVLNNLNDNEYSVISIGKMSDIVGGEGITKTIKSSPANIDTINKLTDIMDKNFTGLCITNLNEFEQAGISNNIEDYARMIEEFDVEVPLILNKLNNDDLLIITADRGNDPTFENVNNTRENLPVIVFGRNFKTPKKMEILNSLADIGATIADNFDVPNTDMGNSFLEELK